MAQRHPKTWPRMPEEWEGDVFSDALDMHAATMGVSSDMVVVWTLSCLCMWPCVPEGREVTIQGSPSQLSTFRRCGCGCQRSKRGLSSYCTDTVPSSDAACVTEEQEEAVETFLQLCQCFMSLLVIVWQAVHYLISYTIYMYGIIIKVGKVFPPPCLPWWQVQLCLEVLKTLVVSNHSKISSQKCILPFHESFQDC